LLFSEDFASNNEINSKKSDFDDLHMKTVSEFQKNVLFYGLGQKDDKEEVKIFVFTHLSLKRIKILKKMLFIIYFYFFFIVKIVTKLFESEGEEDAFTSRSNLLNEKSVIQEKPDDDSSDYHMFSLLNLTKKKISETEPDIEMQSQDIRLKRINRGYSARRYLSSWTKHWDQKLLNNLIKDGKITEETIFESNVANNNKIHKKKRLNDDLSTIPPAYRIHRHWLFTPGNLKGYRFFKVQDYYLTKMFKGMSI